MKSESGYQEHTPNHPYSAIVVMPYSSIPYRRGRHSNVDPAYALSYESKMTALATVQAYEEGMADKVILIGEDTYGSQQKHTTDQFLKELLVSKGIPEEAIESYSGHNNTFEQISKLEEVSSDKPDEKFLVISLNFHQPRVKEVTDRKNIPAEHASTEDILKRRSKHYEAIVNEWENSEDMKNVILKEKFLYQPLSKIDVKGFLQKHFTELSGPRDSLTKFPKKPPTKD